MAYDTVVSMGSANLRKIFIVSIWPGPAAALVLQETIVPAPGTT